MSDRCFFKFNEIDVDTQVKKETHVMQKYTNSIITLPEARLELGKDMDYDKDELFAGIQASIQMDMAEKQAELAADKAGQNTAQSTKDATSDKQTSAQKGQRNLPSRSRGNGNVIRPANQQGRRNSPDIRRADLSWLTVIENALKEEYNVIEKDIEEKKVEE